MAVAITGTIPSFTTDSKGLIQATAEANRRAVERQEERALLAEELAQKRIDRIEISQAAVEQIQAEVNANQVREELANNFQQYLGLDPSFDEEV